MKKFLALLAALLLICSLALAEEAPQVYVSITDDTGALVLAAQSVSLTDMDGDAALTIFDALACAHAAHNPEGAAAFAAENTDYGLSMTRLWGVENGGSYGYYLNDASAWSLLDPVADGDHVKAFAYTDLVAWSDTYCFFDQLTVQAAPGAQTVLTLSAAGYDESWNPVTLPVAGAAITVNGEATELVTDENGQVTLTLDAAGQYVVSASSETMKLVAPVCVITVAE